MADTYTAWNMATHPVVELEDDWNNLLAHGLVKPYRYIIRQNDSYIECLNASTGKLVYGGEANVGGIDGTDATDVIQAAIDACAGNPGKIVLMNGIYTLTAKLTINTSGIELCGESAGGDHYFTRDGTYYGLSNKIAVVLVADGIDAIHIGSSAFCFGITIRDLLITGTANEATFFVVGDPDLASEILYTDESGIYIQRGNTILIENVQITAKEYGIYANTGVFAWDKVIDILTVRNLYLSYNKYGIYSDGAWIGDSTFQNIYGYLNYRGLIHGNFQYNVLFDGVTSQNDNWAAGTAPLSALDCPLYIETYRNISFRHIDINGDVRSDYPLIYLYASGLDAVGFEFGAYITMDHVQINGSNNVGIYVNGSNGTYYTQILIRNLVAARGGGDYSMIGGFRKITSSVIYIPYTCNTEVIVDGGDVDSEIVGVANVKNWWFTGLNKSNQIIVRNLDNFYDRGKITSPFKNAYEVTGTADAGTNQTSMIDAARGEADDAWNGYLLCYTSGAANGECLPITDFIDLSDETVTSAFAGVPAAGDTYEIRETALGEDTIGFQGVDVAPVASTEYTVNGVDVLLTTTDSGGADCSITVKDADANTVVSGLSDITSPMLLPVKWTINWGAYTGAAPTVGVYAANT